ncbi:MAG: dethiobiotin synthase [Sporichthyaceae bacterium]
MSIVVVTGTGTGVGKTVVTAALAALAVEREAPVAVVKVAQTGVGPDEPADLAQIAALSGARSLVEFARYPDPLSPEAAARHARLPEVDLDDAAVRIRDLADLQQLVLVEGAGGLLVRYTSDGATLADLARDLQAPILVVVDPGLGTLNATALTLEAIAHRGLRLSGLVVGSWPDQPDLACRCNLEDLTALAARPLLGLMPANIGAFDRASFVTAARAGLAPSLGGSFDAADFLRTHRPR